MAGKQVGINRRRGSAWEEKQGNVNESGWGGKLGKEYEEANEVRRSVEEVTLTRRKKRTTSEVQKCITGHYHILAF